MILERDADLFAAVPDYPFDPHFVEWNGIRLHYLEGAGHFLQEESPDRVGRAIVAFLDRT